MEDPTEDTIIRLTDCQCCEPGSADKGHRGEQQWKSLTYSKSTCETNAGGKNIIKYTA